MKKMIALKDQIFGSRRLKTGEVFEVAQDSTAKILIAIKRAQYHEEIEANSASNSLESQTNDDGTGEQVQEPAEQAPVQPAWLAGKKPGRKGR